MGAAPREESSKFHLKFHTTCIRYEISDKARVEHHVTIRGFHGYPMIVFALFARGENRICAFPEGRKSYMRFSGGAMFVYAQGANIWIPEKKRRKLLLSKALRIKAGEGVIIFR